MATKVHMEALSPTMEEGQLVRWLKNEGDEIAEGDVLAEVETDKATMELVARGSGVLRARILKEGDSAPVGQVIGVIAGKDEDISAIAGGAPAGGAADAAAEEQPPDGAAEATKEKQPAGGADAGGAVAPTAGGPTEQHRAEAVEQPASRPGHPVQELSQATATATAEGTAVGKGQHIEQPAAAGPADGGAGGAAASQGGAESAASTGGAQAAAGGKAAGAGEAADVSGDGRTKASPLARKLAADSGIDLGRVQGSGPGGRVIRRDIEAAQKGGGAAAAPAGGQQSPGAAAKPAPLPPMAVAHTGPEVEEIPISQMRKTIAKRLVTSIGPVPTFYLTVELDMSRMQEARERLNERLNKSGVKVSVNDLLVKATAMALTRHPEVNAAWGENVIRRFRRVHIGVAVAVEDGLITPIVRDAHLKGVVQIAQEIRELAGRAREKKLQPDEYTGATFSISNLGMFGIDEFTAIINPPEAAILAVGRVEEKVVVEDGEAVIAPRMRITMSCDHRVIDGASGAKFLQTLRDFIEEPTMMLV